MWTGTFVKKHVFTSACCCGGTTRNYFAPLKPVAFVMMRLFRDTQKQQSDNIFTENVA